MVKIKDVYKWHRTRMSGYYSSDDDVYINENMVVKVSRFRTNIDNEDKKGNLTIIYLLGNIGRGINGTDGITVTTGMSVEDVVKRIGGGK